MSDIPNKLRFCCLPVLPTVFSDELSYMEVLCKMRDYINQMIEALKQQDEDIANIQKQVDKVDPSNYIQVSGGTLTGPLFFLDQNSVVKNADGTFTVQSINPVVLKSGQTLAANATGGIELRSGGTVLVTGDDGVSILDKTSSGVAVYDGHTAIAGDIEINGTTTFGNVDVDMLNARTKVAEPVEDANPATKKYVDEHGGGSGSGVVCGYITVTVDGTKTTVDVHSENLLPKAELGGYYADNAGNLWHATQVVTGGYTLENQNINVLENAGFVRIAGNTSVKNINVNDTGSSTYQATTNVTVHGGTDVDITAGKGTVDIEGPIVDVHATSHVNIDTADGGSVVIGGAKSAVDMYNAVSVMVPTPVKDTEAATKLYVDQHAGGGGGGLKLAQLNESSVCIPASAFNVAGPTTVWVNVALDSAGTSYALGTVTVYSGNIAHNNVVAVFNNEASVASLNWDASVGLIFGDSTIDESTYFGGVYEVVK